MEFIIFENFAIPLENILCVISKSAIPRPFKAFTDDRKNYNMIANDRSYNSTEVAIILSDERVLFLGLTFDTVSKRLRETGGNFVLVDKGCVLNTKKVLFAEKYNQKAVGMATRNNLRIIKFTGSQAPRSIVYLSTDFALGIRRSLSNFIKTVNKRDETGEEECTEE